VLMSSSDAHHRAIAAQMLGYGHQSREQIDALVRASLDPDDGNDAVRAIEVLAGAKPNLARMVPTDPFVQLLHSGKWSDHNKASLLLVALTKTRDQKLLDQLRTEASTHYWRWLSGVTSATPKRRFPSSAASRALTRKP
jgi:hypothetical protein